MNEALQICPSSGILWALAIELEPTVSRHTKVNTLVSSVVLHLPHSFRV
jgi:hypothetical protein